MATIQQVVEELKELSETELDVLLELVQLKKSFKKTERILNDMYTKHNIAHIPESLTK